jgi:atypical dual specificity phosphatase
MGAVGSSIKKLAQSFYHRAWPYFNLEKLGSLMRFKWVLKLKGKLSKRNFMSQWWIDETTLLGSSNPTDRELEDLYHKGFRTIISLLDEDEQSPYYDTKKMEKIGFKRYSIPVEDFAPPTLADFQKFLDMVNKSLKEGKVLVHCQGGLGRTGTMAAAYWIKKGLSAQKAIRKIQQLRHGAIESPEQKKALHRLEASITRGGR